MGDRLRINRVFVNKQKTAIKGTLVPENSPTPYEICVYCKQPIQPGSIIKRLASGRPAHLVCYTDHIDEEEPASER